MHGYVYFLTNPSMPGLVKIGQTTQDIEARVRQLNSTGVPTAFILAACFAVQDPVVAERAIHLKLVARRHTSDREFFRGTTEDILRECFDSILESLTSFTSPIARSNPAQLYDLDEESIWLLTYLAGWQRHYGYSEYDVLRSTDEPELKTEVRLATLKEYKFVEEKRPRSQSDCTRWRLTSKGKKYLFDFGYVTEEMLRDWR